METKTDFDQERQRLTRWAWGVTGGYGVLLLVLSAFVVFGEEGVDAFRKMSPNEVGDLLAGVAGPVAFIWLVYGYFLQGIAIRQQAEELQQNTAALKLQEESLRAQVSELNASVEQQKDLAITSRKQLEAALDSLAHEKQRITQENSPNFVFSKGTISEGYGDIFFCFLIMKNIGKTATNITLFSSKEISDITPKDIPSLSNGDECTLQWRQSIPIADQDHIISIKYEDAFGREGEQKFILVAEKREESRSIFFAAKLIKIST